MKPKAESDPAKTPASVEAFDAAKLAEQVAAKINGERQNNAVAWIAALSPFAIKLIEVMKPAPSQGLNETLLLELVKMQGNSTAQALEMIERARELVPDSRGPDREAGMWERVLTAVAPSFLSVIKPNLAAGNGPQGAARPALPPGPPAAVHSPNGNGAQPHAAAGGGEPGAGSPRPDAPGGAPSSEACKPTEAAARLNFLFALVLNAAEQDNDPNVYAEILEDQTTDQEAEQLRLALRQDNWFDLLFAHDERAPKVRPWLAELRSCILEAEKPQRT